MHDALNRGYVTRHVEGAPNYLAALPLLTLPGPALTAGRLPVRIIGLCRDDLDLMTARREPRCHFAGVFSDARELRRKIQTDDDDIHRNTTAFWRAAIGV